MFHLQIVCRLVDRQRLGLKTISHRLVALNCLDPGKSV